MKKETSNLYNVTKKWLSEISREDWPAREEQFIEFAQERDPILKEEKARSEFKKICREINCQRSPEEFTPLTSSDLIKTLGLTIKKDKENKIATFLCELSAYTEKAQFNISYNAPSSTGKSYIPTEIAGYFPQEDVKEVGYCSPTAFFHDVGEPDKEQKGSIIVDLSRKILIFLDQPHNQLLERLRPLLSHDKKEINIKITDKDQKQGLRTKNVVLRGFPAVIFCTAGLNIDEQEATRFLLLSPEINQEKIRDGILQTINKEANSKAFKDWLEKDPARQSLRERIRAIRMEEIKEINLKDQKQIEKRFFEQTTSLKPRHQRDIKRLIAFVKSFALLNLWWRDRNGDTITANKDDVEEAFKLWNKISVSQELNLPPYIYELFQKVIIVAYQEKNKSYEELDIKRGLTRQEIEQKHYEVYGKILNPYRLRQQILPVLEIAGLIIQEQDENDKRQYLVYPTELAENNNQESI